MTTRASGPLARQTGSPPASRAGLADHASHADERGIAIDRVGIKGLSWPITVWDREDGMQHTVAVLDATVALPADIKGTHMSRFVEVLNDVKSELSLKNLPDLMMTMQRRLGAERAQLDATFPYFLRRAAPVSRATSLNAYRCGFHAERNGEDFTFELRVEVPVTTLCPCSKAVSDRGAHNQRGYVRVRARSSGMLWIEDVVEAVESVASSPVYGLLKREDEKYVTERAYDHPVFVEDLLRDTVRVLRAHPATVTWLSVEVENIESIHNHSAFASLEWPTRSVHAEPDREGSPTTIPEGSPSFGAWLRGCRGQKGWTQGDLASRIGVSHSLLSKVESDERRLAEPALRRLARALGVEVPLVLLRAGVVPPELMARILADPERFLG
ncbi:MAG: GTP cyclohydrolase I FolE2 [Myxococcales bacterium]|nr:GTP cyclohydrolase I FolE2 [Myxococcales bacterium]